MCLDVGRVLWMSAEATERAVAGLCVLFVRENAVPRPKYVILSRWFVIGPLNVHVEEDIPKMWVIVACIGDKSKTNSEISLCKPIRLFRYII